MIHFKRRVSVSYVHLCPSNRTVVIQKLIKMHCSQLCRVSTKWYRKYWKVFCKKIRGKNIVQHKLPRKNRLLLLPLLFLLPRSQQMIEMRIRKCIMHILILMYCSTIQSVVYIYIISSGIHYLKEDDKIQFKMLFRTHFFCKHIKYIK